MGDHNMSFLFKIDSIEAKGDSPPQYFPGGFYKPPIRRDHYNRLTTTGWLRWTMNDVFWATSPPEPGRHVESTSMFYDGLNTNSFLFHPADCQTTDISDIEEREGSDLWGWQQLCFDERDADHSVLNLGGEYNTLCGQSTSYVPHFLPERYRSAENNARCGLSGNMSLLLALAAFSCRPEYMINAIARRLNFRERRWENVYIQDWGNGRIHGRGLVVHIGDDGVCTDLRAWEKGDRGPLLQ